MKYDSPELRDRLAAEYVLGTLHGKARRRFERLKQQDFSLHHRVWYWERRLAPLSDSGRPEQPHQRVWNRISKTLWPESYREPWWRRLGLWRGMGFVTATAAIVLAVQLNVVMQQAIEPEAQFITVLANEESQAAWMVRVNADDGTVSVKALNVDGPGLRKAFELWMLPRGQNPQSLGLIPVSGELTLPMQGSLVDLLKDSDAFAVSLEPEGGSPTGAPTGPVLYQGKLLTL